MLQNLLGVNCGTLDVITLAFFQSFKCVRHNHVPRDNEPAFNVRCRYGHCAPPFSVGFCSRVSRFITALANFVMYSGSICPLVRLYFAANCAMPWLTILG